ncbi:hypothetical protein PIIN_06623 [Serendipita indica DSM 11827]|uniref:Uncharacterized protein n=1 Tax=Serendipita indica (strain DSM 11827) TaxID=1109443 RepID=G4TMZ3_SERID|nr:hypothetical protein PIIN_06623 [Serendipita indica DSM 11827]
MFQKKPDSESKTHYALLNIRLGTQAEDENWLDEILRVRFLEAKVNHDRWQEESELVQAELQYTQR